MILNRKFDCRVLLLLALLNLATLPETARSAEVPGFEKQVELAAKGHLPAKFIRALFSQIGVPAKVDPGIPGEVHGRFEGTAGDIFKEISKTLNVHLYYNRSVAYVYRADRITERLLRLSNNQSNEVLKAVDALGLTNSMNVINTIPGGGLEVVGHEKFVKKVEDILVTFEFVDTDKAQKKSQTKAVKPSPLVVREFKLKNASAEDYTESDEGQEKVRPGVASLLKEFFGREKSVASIVADPVRNSVWVEDLASRMSDYAKMIESMDAEPQMVEIEVTIIDIDTNRQKELGVNWRAITDGAAVQVGGSNAISPVSAQDDTGGILTLFVGNRTRFFSRMRALEEKGVVSIVSKPHITTKSNLEATLTLSTEFHVRLEGKEQVALETPTYGTFLTVKPRVESDSEKVNLSISIEDGAASDGQVDNIPAIGRSKVSTTVKVFDGASLLLGGMVRESFQHGYSKVPLFGDIPGIGKLFRTDRKNDAKKERMFLITTRIIDINDEAFLKAGPVLYGNSNDIVSHSDKRIEQGREEFALKTDRFKRDFDGESPFKAPMDAIKKSMNASGNRSVDLAEPSVLTDLLVIPPAPNGSKPRFTEVSAAQDLASGKSQWKVSNRVQEEQWQVVNR